MANIRIPICEGWDEKKEISYEFQLFTDVKRVYGESLSKDECPFEIINTKVENVENILLPRLILRIHKPIYKEKFDTTGWELYIENGDPQNKKSIASIILKSSSKKDLLDVGIYYNGDLLWKKEDYCENKLLSDFGIKNEQGIVTENQVTHNLIKKILFVFLFAELNDIYIYTKNPQKWPEFGVLLIKEPRSGSFSPKIFLKKKEIGKVKDYSIDFKDLEEFSDQFDLNEPVSNKNGEIEDIKNEIISHWNLFDDFSELNEPEQVSVLLSLLYGIRLKVGDLSRINNHHLGEPLNRMVHKNPFPIQVVTNEIQSILPSAIESIELDADKGKIKKIFTLCELNKDDILCLIRSAKLYSDALQLIESETSLAWVMLVCAIEVAAGTWKRKEKLDKIKDLKKNYLDIYELIKKNCRTKKCKSLKDSDKIGEKIRFCIFILKFFPEALPKRPKGIFSIGYKKSENNNQVGPGIWDKSSILKCLLCIYSFRSRYFHEGVPFPIAMCSPPYHTQNEELPERASLFVPDGEAIYIWVFEYIVRNSLLIWWDSLLSK